MKGVLGNAFLSRAALRLAIFFMLITQTRGFSQQAISKANQVKALFLYNFTQFVEWPPTCFPSPDAPLIIGVLGADPFGQFIDELIKGEVIQNHPLEVRRYTSVDEIDNCHVLYLSLPEIQTSRALKALGSRPVLTVSDGTNFTRLGGMIRFRNDRGRIAIQINVDATTNAGLVVSSKLLRLSEIVSGENE